jgi:hypothetical protein
MPNYNTTYLRAARLICERLTKAAVSANHFQLPADYWQSAAQLNRAVQLARQRGWYHAALVRQNELASQLDYLQSALAHVTSVLRERSTSVHRASESEVYRDLLALEREFEDVECDFEECAVAVTTQAIALEGIVLGRFQIRLEWENLAEFGSYRVVALDPNPAQTKSDVTHPHVSDDELCEGDGKQAIRSALASGRLLDFFTIVDRLLHTYAPGRAYVELDNWGGTPCHDCGSVVDDDERYSCERCEEMICSDCGCHCEHCDRTCCNGCTATCRACSESACTGCLTRCPSCGHLVCPACFLSNSNHCARCHEELIDEMEPDPEDTESEKAGVEVHAHGVGQAHLPA